MATAKVFTPTSCALEVAVESCFSGDMEVLRGQSDANVTQKGRKARDLYDLRGRSFYVTARVDQRLVGCIRLTPERAKGCGPAIRWLDSQSRSLVQHLRLKSGLIHFSRLVVHPDFQNKGIASLLLLEAFNLIENYKYQRVAALVEPEIISRDRVIRARSFKDFLQEIFQPEITIPATATDSSGSVSVNFMFALIRDGHEFRENLRRRTFIRLQRTFTELSRVHRDFWNEDSLRYTAA